MADIMLRCFSTIPRTPRRGFFTGMFRLFCYLSVRVRSSTGNTPVRKDRAMRQMLRSLKRNEILGILIDQNVAWQVVKAHAEEGATN